MKQIILLSLISLLFQFPVMAQTDKEISNSKGYLSIETAPPYWVLTTRNGFAFSACVSHKLKKNPNIRLGILGYTGRWSEDAAKNLLLTDDFKGDNWEVQWNGFAIETQYLFNLGLARGGLLTGLRTQWNNLEFFKDKNSKATANHIMITPQIGFQWFPFKKLGFYALPWAGFQQDILGTDKVSIDGIETNTRKSNPIITFQIGWEFKL